jgi:protein-L-isoaspartate(D-aspartate) O-methyltransferase
MESVLKEPDRSQQLTGMIGLLRQRGITDRLVLAAMREVERHLFVPEVSRFSSTSNPYGDYPLPIGYGQTISQPFIVAYMLERLNLSPGEKVLEIGTGSGYVAAVLYKMGIDVFSIEISDRLAERAGKILGKGVHLRTGNGYAGWPEEAPFDAVVVSCAPETIPEKLISQLGDNGRMILPLGLNTQKLVVVMKSRKNIRIENDIGVRFVPMVHSEKS